MSPGGDGTGGGVLENNRVGVFGQKDLQLCDSFNFNHKNSEADGFILSMYNLSVSLLQNVISNWTSNSSLSTSLLPVSSSLM